MRMSPSSRKPWRALFVALLPVILAALLWNLSTVQQAISQGIQTVKVLSGNIVADTELPTAAAISADDQAAPTAPSTYGFNFCFDGTNWDRCRGSLVDTDDNTIASAQATSLIVNLPYLFNGTDWKRRLGAANALNSTGDGLAASQLIGQCDDTSPTALTENSFGNLRMNCTTHNLGTEALQSGTWTVQPGNTANTTAWLVKLDQTSTNNDVDVATLPNEGQQTKANSISVALASDQFGDPCHGTAKTYVPFSIASIATTQLVAASASNKLYVCSFNIVVAGANAVAMVEDNDSACASPAAGMAGGTTAATGWTFAANGGMTLGSGVGAVMATASTNRYVCLMTSTTAQASGSLAYVLAP